MRYETSHVLELPPGARLGVGQHIPLGIIGGYRTVGARTGDWVPALKGRQREGRKQGGGTTLEGQ